jgi:hypothetical protein
MVMTPEDKRHLELKRKTVEAIKAAYTRERDARRPSAVLWNEYARALHEYRLMKRGLNDG